MFNTALLSLAKRPQVLSTVQDNFVYRRGSEFGGGGKVEAWEMWEGERGRERNDVNTMYLCNEVSETKIN